MEKIFAPEKIFVTIALLFGLILVLITPPYQIPDEPQHFLRALSLVENYRLIEIKKDSTTGDYLSANLDIIHEKYVPIIKHLERKTSFKDFKQYSKINYDKKNSIAEFILLLDDINSKPDIKTATRKRDLFEIGFKCQSVLLFNE